MEFRGSAIKNTAVRQFLSPLPTSGEGARVRGKLKVDPATQTGLEKQATCEFFFFFNGKMALLIYGKSITNSSVNKK